MGSCTLWKMWKRKYALSAGKDITTLKYWMLLMHFFQSNTQSKKSSVLKWFALIKLPPNRPFQRTRATKRLGVFWFCGVARGAERGRYAGIGP